MTYRELIAVIATTANNLDDEVTVQLWHRQAATGFFIYADEYPINRFSGVQNEGKGTLVVELTRTPQP